MQKRGFVCYFICIILSAVIFSLCCGESYAYEEDTLSPTLRMKPICTIEEQDGELVVVMSTGRNNRLALPILFRVIAGGLRADLDLGPAQLKGLVKANFGMFSGAEDFRGVRWDLMYKKDDAVYMPVAIDSENVCEMKFSRVTEGEFFPEEAKVIPIEDGKVLVETIWIKGNGAVPDDDRKRDLIARIEKGLKGAANPAKKKGEVAHRRSRDGEPAVNNVLSRAFDVSAVRDESAFMSEVVIQALNAPDIKEQLPDSTFIKELKDLARETRIFFIGTPGDNSPALMINDRDNYQIAHVGIGRKSIYLPAALAEEMAEEEPAILIALLLRELMVLSQTTEHYDGTNYDKAVDIAEIAADRLERVLVGERLNEYVQEKVDKYMQKKISSGERDMGTSNPAKMRGYVVHRRSGPDDGLTVNEAVREAFERETAPEDATELIAGAVSDYLDKSTILEASVIRDLKGVLEETSFFLLDNPLNESPALVIYDSRNYQIAHVGIGRKSIYLPAALVQDMAIRPDDLLAALLVRELAVLYMALQEYDGTNYDKSVARAEQFAERVEKMLVGHELNDHLDDRVKRYVTDYIQENRYPSGDDSELQGILGLAHTVLDVKELELSEQLLGIMPVERPNTLIMYADDMIDKGVVMDLGKVLASKGMADKRILRNGKIVLYTKEKGKLSEDVTGLKTLIENADPTIDVHIVDLNDLEGYGNIANDRDEMWALKRYATQQLYREEHIRPSEEQFLGIFRGPHANLYDAVGISDDLKTPVILFSDRAGIYSFAEALMKALAIKMDPDPVQYYAYLNPIQPLDVERLQIEFRRYVHEVLVKA